MEKVLGIPRNAVIVAGAVLLVAAALAMGFLIPFGGGSAAKEGQHAQDAGNFASGPAAPNPSRPQAGNVAPPAVVENVAPAGTIVDVSKEPTMGDLRPTLITVNFDNLQVMEAFAAFSSQTSIPVNMLQAIPPETAGLPPVSMHLQNAPYYEGIFELVHAAHARINELNVNNVRLTFPPPSLAANALNPEGIGRWSLSGPFAMVISHINHAVDLTGAPGRAPGTASLVFSLYAEPAVNVVQYPKSVIFEEFVDEKNLPIGATVSHISSPNALAPRAMFSAALTPSPGHGRKIARLRVRASFIVGSHVQTLRTVDPGDTVDQAVGDMQVHIGPIVGGDNYSLDIHYSRGKMDPGAWTRFRTLAPSLVPTLLSVSDGRATPTPTARAQADSADSVVVHVTVPAAGPNPPHHLRLDVPLDFREVAVPFEFHDLILP